MEEKVRIFNISYSESKKLIILTCSNGEVIESEVFNGIQLDTYFIEGDKVKYDRIKNCATKDVTLIVEMEKRGNFYRKAIVDIKLDGNSVLL